MSIQTQLIEYEDTGVTLEGFLAWDDARTGPRPAVAIAHTWAGRGQFEEDKARRLAELGYAGFALDLYGKGVYGSGPDENAALMQPFLDDRAMLQQRLLAGVNAMKASDVADASRCAAMGFCFGGLCALDLARIGAELAGVVSFHGLFGAPGNTAGRPIDARVLALHGWNDPMVPPAHVTALAEELSSAGADWQIHAYGGTAHAFTNPAADDEPNGMKYNPVADRRSWLALRNFLQELFPGCDIVAAE